MFVLGPCSGCVLLSRLPRDGRLLARDRSLYESAAVDEGTDRAGGDADEVRCGGVTDPLSTFGGQSFDLFAGEAQPASGGVSVAGESACCRPPVHGGVAYLEAFGNITWTVVLGQPGLLLLRGRGLVWLLIAPSLGDVGCGELFHTGPGQGGSIAVTGALLDTSLSDPPFKGVLCDIRQLRRSGTTDPLGVLRRTRNAHEADYMRSAAQ